MTAADLPAVGRFAGRLLRMHHDWDRARFLQPADPERGYVHYFTTQLASPDAILLVAEDDAGLLGYVFARMEPRNFDELLDPCTKLHDIFVDDRARKNGVGEALLRATFREAARRGAPRVLLLTAAQNEAGQRLFKKVGFRTTMLEMTCELDASQGD